ncbi:TPA: hypothetical protein VIU28_000301 [Streptococcus pyogenes]|uniref:hypothetical protein n=1 Tax=Streptococcus infantis TaxID=68892 RepID=UPI002B399EB8|nr:hypothetical protein [Streptococcus pyogenes]HER6661487.1 hypothetical protein [Streptococcus pyogenes]HER6663333.1 hypothetical protein [Streptococcus pyogenes]HES8020807.1 hypothetical protein [Streptococcus pyogenes]
MVTKYYKYIPWLILGAIGSYESATYFGYSTFDKLYLSIVFMIVYVALFILHEKYLKNKYKEIFTHIMSNSEKDHHP